MPFWIEGWVEVTRDLPSEEDEHSWQGLLRVGPLVDGADEVSEELFGLSKRLVSSEQPHGAVAARRGVPPHPSAELRADLVRIAEHERIHGPGELGGYTYATWSELSAFRAARPDVLSSDWAIVFDIAERVATDPRFSCARLRLVVWYNW
ncbi:hypothetical protein [Sorangium sp. So ce1335]|uniref:hypothetical protein n=1 Tax=Sorangium sp. So ce1335 TaxID=3133335 RepID=UPI003F629519